MSILLLFIKANFDKIKNNIQLNQRNGGPFATITQNRNTNSPRVYFPLGSKPRPRLLVKPGPVPVMLDKSKSHIKPIKELTTQVKDLARQANSNQVTPLTARNNLLISLEREKLLFETVEKEIKKSKIPLRETWTSNETRYCRVKINRKTYQIADNGKYCHICTNLIHGKAYKKLVEKAKVYATIQNRQLMPTSFGHIVPASIGIVSKAGNYGPLDQEYALGMPIPLYINQQQGRLPVPDLLCKTPFQNGVTLTEAYQSYLQQDLDFYREKIRNDEFLSSYGINDQWFEGTLKSGYLQLSQVVLQQNPRLRDVLKSHPELSYPYFVLKQVNFQLKTDLIRLQTGTIYRNCYDNQKVANENLKENPNFVKRSEIELVTQARINTYKKYRKIFEKLEIRFSFLKNAAAHCNSLPENLINPITEQNEQLFKNYLLVLKDQVENHFPLKPDLRGRQSAVPEYEKLLTTMKKHKKNLRKKFVQLNQIVNSPVIANPAELDAVVKEIKNEWSVVSGIHGLNKLRPR